MAVEKYRDENGNWVEVGYSGGGSDITVDSSMSDTSENPVQNKVVKTYIDGMIGDINIVLDTINGEVI